MSQLENTRNNLRSLSRDTEVATRQLKLETTALVASGQRRRGQQDTEGF